MRPLTPGRCSPRTGSPASWRHLIGMPASVSSAGSSSVHQRQIGSARLLRRPCRWLRTSTRCGFCRPVGRWPSGGPNSPGRGDIRSGWTMVKTLYSTWQCVASASCSGFSRVRLSGFARARPQPHSLCSTTATRVVMARQDYSRSGTPSGMAPILEVWCSPWAPRTDD